MRVGELLSPIAGAMGQELLKSDYIPKLACSAAARSTTWP